MAGVFFKLKVRGAVFMNGLIESTKKDASGNYLPADRPTIDRWLKAFHSNYDIALDLDGQTMPRSSGIPRNYLINPRDMVIYKVNEGVNPDASTVPGLKVLLDYNHAPMLPTTTPVDAGRD